MKILIEQRNDHGVLVNPTPDAELYVRDVVAYDVRSYVPGANRYTSRRVSMVDPSGRFPPGMTPLLAKLAAQDGNEVEVIDRRVRPPGAFDESAWDGLPVDPLEFQVQAARTAHEKGNLIISVDVGGGKTIIITMIVAAIPVRWVILAHRDELVENISKSLTDAGIDHVTHTSRRRRVGHITVATYSSAVKPEHAAALFSGAQGLIAEECHTASTNTAVAVFSHAKDVFYRIGLSGTPLDRSDAKSVVAVGYLGPVGFRVTNQELEAMGRVVPAEVTFVEFNHEPTTKTKYAAIYREVIATNRRRNELIASILERAAKPCICFIEQMDQMVELVKLARKRLGKDQVQYVWGESSPEERAMAQSRARGEFTDVTVASVVWQEGINIPNLGSIVIASANKAVIRIVQRLGRGTRKTDGKDSFELWDVLDQDIEIFYRQARERKRIYQKRGYPIRVITEKELTDDQF